MKRYSHTHILKRGNQILDKRGEGEREKKRERGVELSRVKKSQNENIF